MRFETPASFANRLRQANHIPQRAWNQLVTAQQSADGTSREDAEETLAATLGAVHDDHFQRARAQLPSHEDTQECLRCVTGLVGRVGCVMCARGDRVDELAHDEYRVCHRHCRWVGTGGESAEQFTVTRSVVRADRRYQALRRAGLIDAHRLAELEGCVAMWATGELGTPSNPAERFRIAVALADAMFGRGSTAALWSADGAGEMRGKLVEIVAQTVGAESSHILTDQVWLLIRPSAAADPANVHEFRRVPLRDDHALSSHLNELQTSAYPRRVHLHLTQFVTTSQPGTRFDLQRSSSHKHDYECRLAHQFESLTPTLERSGEHGGCPYCARKKPLPGFNTVADTHPELLTEWDQGRNGDLRPDQLLAGSGIEIQWLCTEEGHPYAATLNARTTKGIGCGYCSNQLVSPHINSLSFTHPELAREWHPTKNGDLTADDLVSGSERDVWWLCPDEGHAYETAPAYRKAGHGCHYCARHKVHPTTCLAATNPDVAEGWNYELNNGLTPYDVFAGSIEKVFWNCDGGHAHDQAIVSRVRGIGCRFCSNYEVSPTNNMAVTRPDLAAQFHPTKNHPLTPETVVAGTSLKLWWRCEEFGHEWPTTGDLRVRQNTGCPTCSNKRVLAGFNDMATTRPDLAAELHPTKNEDLRATDFVAGTAKPLWWQCACGCEWEARGDVRAKGGRPCPDCKARAREAARAAEAADKGHAKSSGRERLAA